MEIVHTASGLNRDGANHLAAGDEHKALEAFSHALHLVTELASITDIEQLQCLTRYAESLRAAPQTRRQDERAGKAKEEHPDSAHWPQSKYRHCIITAVPLKGLVDNEFYIYNRAIVYHPPEISPHANLTFYSAVILCNMALCYHRSSRRTGRSSMHDMACRLYDACGQSMKEYLHTVGDKCHLVLLIALNNQAELLYQYTDFKYERIMSEMIEHIQISRSSRKIHPGLLVNILMCGTLRNATSPAA